MTLPIALLSGTLLIALTVGAEVGSPVAVGGPGGVTRVQSQFDLVGLRAKMQSSLGAHLDIERNNMGDVTGVRAADGFDARVKRDLLGMELSRELPGGVRSRWQRDKLGRPVQHDLLSGDTLLKARSYHWDKNDRLRMIVDALQGPVQYTHDQLGNLAAAAYADGTVELRMPDAVGNLFKREDRRDRKYGPAGQLLESTDAHGRTTRYAYDAEGNLVEKRTNGGAVWRHQWDAAGMLSRVTRPDETEVTFKYDALGRRIQKRYRGQTTRWVWDGNVPLHEWVEGELEPAPEPAAVPVWTADADIKKREAELTEHLLRGPPERGSAEAPITWLFEPESFAPMAKLGPGGTHSIVTDHLGTPLAMRDDKGQQRWSADISVYGELRNLDGDRHACPFRWPGQYEDPETGLYYNRFRYYDPEAGQYASQDPSALLGGDRLHACVVDPLCLFDPMGLVARPAQMGDHQLFEHIHEVLYRDKRATGGKPSGRHGLVHRLREQITGKMRPGTRGWKTHEDEIRRAKKALREALTEWDRRGLPHADQSGRSLFGEDVWKLATEDPPPGSQTKVPKQCR